MAPRISTNSRGPWEVRDPREPNPFAWMAQGACVGAPSELFFPNDTEHEVIRQAKALCQTCPVLKTCADHAFTHREDYGVWGGMSERDRRRIRRQRRKARTQEPMP